MFRLFGGSHNMQASHATHENSGIIGQCVCVRVVRVFRIHFSFSLVAVFTNYNG